MRKMSLLHRTHVLVVACINNNVEVFSSPRICMVQMSKATADAHVAIEGGGWRKVNDVC
jgi:uncharacterized lipoprotein YbaY